MNSQNLRLLIFECVNCAQDATRGNIPAIPLSTRVIPEALPLAIVQKIMLIVFTQQLRVQYYRVYDDV